MASSESSADTATAAGDTDNDIDIDIDHVLSDDSDDPDEGGQCLVLAAGSGACDDDDPRKRLADEAFEHVVDGVEGRVAKRSKAEVKEFTRTFRIKTGGRVAVNQPTGMVRMTRIDRTGGRPASLDVPKDFLPTECPLVDFDIHVKIPGTGVPMALYVVECRPVQGDARLWNKFMKSKGDKKKLSWKWPARFRSSMEFPVHVRKLFAPLARSKAYFMLLPHYSEDVLSRVSDEKCATIARFLEAQSEKFFLMAAMDKSLPASVLAEIPRAQAWEEDVEFAQKVFRFAVRLYETTATTVLPAEPTNEMLESMDIGRIAWAEGCAKLRAWGLISQATARHGGGLMLFFDSDIVAASRENAAERKLILRDSPSWHEDIDGAVIAIVDDGEDGETLVVAAGAVATAHARKNINGPVHELGALTTAEMEMYKHIIVMRTERAGLPLLMELMRLRGSVRALTLFGDRNHIVGEGLAVPPYFGFARLCSAYENTANFASDGWPVPLAAWQARATNHLLLGDVNTADPRHFVVCGVNLKWGAIRTMVRPGVAAGPGPDSVVVCATPEILHNAESAFMGQDVVHGILNSGRKSHIIDHLTGRVGRIQSFKQSDDMLTIDVAVPSRQQANATTKLFFTEKGLREHVSLLHLDTMLRCMAAPAKQLFILVDENTPRKDMINMLKLARDRVTIIFVPETPQGKRTLAQLPLERPFPVA